MKIYAVDTAEEDSFLVTGNTKYFPQKPVVVTPARHCLVVAPVS
jgi:hypothetical protein